MLDNLKKKLLSLLSAAGGFSDPEDIAKARQRNALRYVQKDAAQPEAGSEPATTQPPENESVK